ncbi:MAG: hypothetical protein E3K32_12075 [wastewater metagenome]|nr:hypothetical protein [Candidatus Loosdrechtia aerotolerans]
MKSLEGKSILITSGPMRGYIDAVRYISNKSTGKLGAAIAVEALERGASVTFIYGTGSVTPHVVPADAECLSRLTLIEIETLDDLLTTLRERRKATSFDAIVHAMAVLDYIPESLGIGKISSRKDGLTVPFVRAPKIIKVIRTLWPHALLIGFKLEVGLSKDELVNRAYASLIDNSADFVVANDQDQIAADTHRAYLVNTDKKIEFECGTKQGISKNLVDVIVSRLVI